MDQLCETEAMDMDMEAMTVLDRTGRVLVSCTPKTRRASQVWPQAADQTYAVRCLRALGTENGADGRQRVALAASWRE